MSILDDIRASTEAQAKLRRIAKGEPETLTADEAKKIVEHMDWASQERESLLRDRPEDD